MKKKINKGLPRYFQCPYCPVYLGTPKRKLPKRIGQYKVKWIETKNVLIFQCQRCGRSFRVLMFGQPLLWGDMSFDEQRAFTFPKWLKKKVQNEKKSV